MLKSADVIDQVKGDLKAAFGIPPGGAPPLKGDCAHEYEFLGRFSATSTAGLCSSSTRATIARCTKCAGYVIGKDELVRQLVKAHPAPEARPGE